MRREGDEMYLPLCPLHARGPITTSRTEVIFDGDLQEYRALAFDLEKQETTSHRLPDALQAQLLAEHFRTHAQIAVRANIRPSDSHAEPDAVEE